MAASCSLTAAPPRVAVRGVQLRGLGLLDQELGVDLCVTNLGTSELAFRRVTVGIDVNGTPLADGMNEVPVRLPPRSSTDVPFEVVTTVRNLVPQLMGVLQTGVIGYRLHGTVQLAGALPLTLPFSRSGQLGIVAAAEGVLADPALPASTDCGPGAV